MKRRRFEKCHLLRTHIVDLHHRVIKYQVEGLDTRRAAPGGLECTPGAASRINSREIRRDESTDHHRSTDNDTPWMA